MTEMYMNSYAELSTQQTLTYRTISTQQTLTYRTISTQQTLTYRTISTQQTLTYRTIRLKITVFRTCVMLIGYACDVRAYVPLVKDDKRKVLTF
jgi:hypothetical protein